MLRHKHTEVTYQKADTNNMRTRISISKLKLADLIRGIFLVILIEFPQDIYFLVSIADSIESIWRRIRFRSKSNKMCRMSTSTNHFKFWTKIVLVCVSFAPLSTVLFDVNAANSDIIVSPINCLEIFFFIIFATLLNLRVVYNCFKMLDENERNVDQVFIRLKTEITCWN